MKRIAITALALFSAAPAAAYTDDQIAFCAFLGTEASTAYVDYATNVPMSDRITAAQGDEALLAIVEWAYSRPLMFTDDQIVTEAAAFANEVQAACFSGYSE